MKNKKVLLLAAVLLIAVHGVSYAQLDLKAKAVETLTNGVMKQLEKKFTDIVAKEAISAAAKTNVVNKLSEISRPIVKNFIDNSTSGKLPNAAELVNKVLNDVVPRVPEIVAASLIEGDVPDVKTALPGVAPPPGQMTTAVNASLSNVPGYDDEKDFTVETIDGGSAARITKYSGKNTEIRIPPRIGNNTVTEIGERVFTKKGLTSVIIPESVIFIGNMAFADNQINSISIGSNVYIANNAFDGSGYNPSFVGFYNSQGRRAGTYNNGWRIVSGAAPQPVTQPARPATGSTASASTPSAATAASATQATTAKQSGPKITSESTVTFAGNGHRYEVIDTPMNWEEARNECEKRGGYLATITSKEEQAFILDLVIKQGKKHNCYWLGGYPEGKNWQWVTGENFSYKNWVSGKPSSSSSQIKMFMHRYDNIHGQYKRGQWEVDNGSWGYGYICEWDAD